MAAQAQGAGVTYTANTNLSLSSPQAATITILAGSTADSVVTNASNIVVSISAGETFTVVANGLGATVGGSAANVTVTNICTGVGQPNATVVIASSIGSGTFTVTPTGAACNAGGSGGGIGTGGGGSVNPPAPSPTSPAPVPTPPPSGPGGAQPTYSNPPRNVVNNGTVYLSNGVNLLPYTSAGAFLSYGFNHWTDVVAAMASDLASPVGSFVPPRNGTLVNDDGTVYIITGGKRAGFTSAAVFAGLGFSFSTVILGDTSFLVALPPISTSTQAHPQGTLVNDHGTLYAMGTANKIGIPTMAVLQSWGFKISELVIANSYDTAMPASPVLQTRTSRQFGI